jgi:hypothetical protein
MVTFRRFRSLFQFRCAGASRAQFARHVCRTSLVGALAALAGASSKDSWQPELEASPSLSFVLKLNVAMSISQCVRFGDALAECRAKPC